ncbi:hypothetical protein DFH29DRAFT_785340, partial [Suillus ampliporus]
IPPKVDEAVRQYKYIPYISVTPAARLYAFRSSEETFSFNSQGILMAKGLDRSRERSIRFHEWLTASRIVEERKAHLHCFQCGHSGHLPGDCSAETTSAGKTLALLATSAKSCHALTAPNGKHFCFNWAKSAASELILSLPPGCVAATFDISAAYRITPVQPCQQNSLCVFWRGVVYVDRA